MEISNGAFAGILVKVGDMMKKRKMISAIMIFFILIMSIFNTVIADDAISDPRDNPGAYQPGDVNGADRVMDIGNRIIGIIRFVGSFASVIVLIVIGIKYMSGSIEERAEYKKTMVPYIVGAVLVFGITNLLGIVDNITGGLF